MAKLLIDISLLLIAASFIMTLVRFMIGKSVADRVVALDVFTISSIGMLVILSFTFKRMIYLDVAIVYGLLSFIGVIVVARFMDKKQ